MTSSNDPLQPLTVNYVAELLQKHPNTIYQYIKQGLLPVIIHYEGQRQAKKILILRKDLEAFLYGKYNNYGDNRKKVTLVQNVR
jgi:predicted site-specific integrase-resolvase